MREGIDEIAIGLCLEALQGDGTAGRIPYQALQLVTPVGWDMGVGVQRKPLDAGTVGTGERWRLTLVAKPGANTPHLLAGPLAEAMRCCTEAAMVRASSGALSSRGSYPVATAASMPAS